MTRAERERALAATSLRFRLTYTPEVEATSINALELSNRSMHGLQHAKVQTIGEVLSKWTTLGKIRNLGETSVKEIHASVFAYIFEHGHVGLMGLS